MRTLIAAALLLVSVPAVAEEGCGTHKKMAQSLAAHGERMMASMSLTAVVMVPERPDLPPTIKGLPAQLFVDMNDGSWTILVQQYKSDPDADETWCIGGAGEGWTPDTFFGNGRPS